MVIRLPIPHFSRFNVRERQNAQKTHIPHHLPVLIFACQCADARVFFGHTYDCEHWLHVRVHMCQRNNRVDEWVSEGAQLLFPCCSMSPPTQRLRRTLVCFLLRVVRLCSRVPEHHLIAAICIALELAKELARSPEGGRVLSGYNYLILRCPHPPLVWMMVFCCVWTRTRQVRRALNVCFMRMAGIFGFGTARISG